MSSSSSTTTREDRIKLLREKVAAQEKLLEETKEELCHMEQEFHLKDETLFISENGYSMFHVRPNKQGKLFIWQDSDFRGLEVATVRALAAQLNYWVEHRKFRE
jgi:hypothetical protein